MRNIDTKITRYNQGLIVFSVIPVTPDDDYPFGKEDDKYDGDNQYLDIGGTNDVYRNNPSKSLRDSDLVDADPLKEELAVPPENDAGKKEIDDEDIAPPCEGDQDDTSLHTLKEDGNSLDANH
ncbi:MULTISPECIES: hypothetical protein [Sphingobacterium]|uniref:hypothetical protein n=1 Tax=Sphingobacterium TaxID=28453 RepID=UPI0013DD5742|nr:MULTISPECIES: hypothetical protein [unclassified Sphingobacterium]